MTFFIHSFVPQDVSSGVSLSRQRPECSVMLRWSRGDQPHGPTVTCCIFLIDGRGFMPWGGYREPCTSEGLREAGTGRGLTEPGSLCTEPPLPSDWPSFFLISFLSLALRFWNQIFTWKKTEKFSSASTFDANAMTKTLWLNSKKISGQKSVKKSINNWINK